MNGQLKIQGTQEFMGKEIPIVTVVLGITKKL